MEISECIACSKGYVLLLETLTLANFSVGVHWVTVCKEDYRQKSLKAVDLRYFRKFINFRTSLIVRGREVLITESLRLCQR